MSENAEANPNTVALLSHFTVIGWVIALVMYQKDRSSIGAFYIRQTLGLMILLGAVSIIGWVLGPFYWLLVAAVAALWVVSLLGAVNNKEQEVPILGPLFQDWFQTIG